MVGIHKCWWYLAPYCRLCVGCMDWWPIRAHMEPEMAPCPKPEVSFDSLHHLTRVTSGLATCPWDMMLRGHLSQQCHPLQKWHTPPDADGNPTALKQGRHALRQLFDLYRNMLESWVPEQGSTVWKSNSGEFHVSHNIRKKEKNQKPKKPPYHISEVPINSSRSAHK